MEPRLLLLGLGPRSGRRDHVTPHCLTFHQTWAQLEALGL